MGVQLAIEDQHKSLVDLLFIGHGIEDISSHVADRKSGTDFWLRPEGYDCADKGWRCENKFEQKATGRQLFEITSLDRPKLVPGWMFTSRTAWLLSWYPSSEVVALPMDDARQLILRNPSRHRTTTARNRTYLSWSALEDINHVVRSLDRARVLDLQWEIGRRPTESRMLTGASLDKRCTANELVQLMTSTAKESTPVAISDADLIALMREMAPKNFKRSEHADMLERLSWL
jgi:hypothetical protein